jgi:hypothetical protein
MATLFTIATVVALIAAVGGTVTDGRLASAFGGVAVGVIVAAPLLRVAQLGAHWLRIGDRRFALAALGLLLVTAAGAALALL